MNLKTAKEHNDEAMRALERKYGVSAISEIKRVLKECQDRTEQEKKNINNIIDGMEL